MTGCETLRAAGLSVQMHAAGAEGWGGIKAQFRRADASGARHAVVFGDDELARGEVAVKSLRDAASPQRSIALSALESWARTLDA
jgi:histidyl-tRNA synthetase